MEMSLDLEIIKNGSIIRLDLVMHRDGSAEKRRFSRLRQGSQFLVGVIQNAVVFQKN